MAHLLSGLFLLFLGIKNLVRPDELSPYRSPDNAFAYQYGGAIVEVVLGVALVVIGLFVMRAAKRPSSEPPNARVYIYEPDAMLGRFFGAPCILFTAMVMIAVVPYTAEHGVVPGQLAAGFFLILLVGGAAWVFLHYRRTAVIDPGARTVEIRYGKPWPVLRWRHSFDEYQAVAIEAIKRKRSTTYRVVASAEGKKPLLIAFWFYEPEATTELAEIARATGWRS